VQDRKNWLEAIAISSVADADKRRAFWSEDQLDQDPLAGLGDLPLVLELKLQLFNYLGQPLSCKGVGGLQGEPAGLLQLSFQYHAPHACHLGAPIYPEFSKMCTDTLTIR
jgi:hypothetical protein